MGLNFIGNSDHALFNFTSLLHIIAGMAIALIIMLTIYNKNQTIKRPAFFGLIFSCSVFWEILELYQRIIYPHVINIIKDNYVATIIIFFTSTESFTNIFGDIVANMLGGWLVFFLIKKYKIILK